MSLGQFGHFDWPPAVTKLHICNTFQFRSALTFSQNTPGITDRPRKDKEKRKKILGRSLCIHFENAMSVPDHNFFSIHCIYSL